MRVFDGPLVQGVPHEFSAGDPFLYRILVELGEYVGWDSYLNLDTGRRATPAGHAATCCAFHC